jgi:hypothetical protein
MKTKSTLIILVLILLLSPVYAQDRLVAQRTLFTGSMVLQSNQQQQAIWQRVALFKTPQEMSVSLQIPQKWRLRIFYSVTNASSPFSIQARVSLNDTQKPIFSLGWDNGQVGSREAYSNWLEPGGMPQNSEIPLDLYIARETGSNQAQVTIHTIQLEVWQENASLDSTKAQMASAGSPVFRASNQPNQAPKPRLENPTEAAMQVGLNFLKAAMSGDVKQMQQYLSTRPVNMNTLTPATPYDLNTITLPAGKAFSDYLKNYEPVLIRYAEVAGLFDDWEKYVVHNWQISEKSYIFMGNQIRVGGTDFLANEALVLILEEENGIMVVKGIL